MVGGWRHRPYHSLLCIGPLMSEIDRYGIDLLTAIRDPSLWDPTLYMYRISLYVSSLAIWDPRA